MFFLLLGINLVLSYLFDLQRLSSLLLARFPEYRYWKPVPFDLKTNFLFYDALRSEWVYNPCTTVLFDSKGYRVMVQVIQAII